MQCTTLTAKGTYIVLCMNNVVLLMLSISNRQKYTEHVNR